MQDACLSLKHLMIAVPSYTGDVTARTAHSIIGAMPACFVQGINVDVRFGVGCCYIDLVRNDLVRQFLASEADRLLFVDADVGFSPDAVLKVANTERPVVAGVYPKKKTPPEWPVSYDCAYVEEDPETGLVEVAGVATGFLCVHRQVFEAMQPHVPWIRDDRQIDMHAYFRAQYRDGRFYGEDFDFCNLWRSLGGKVWISPDIDFTHTGPNEWSGNYQTWFMGRAEWEKIEGWNNCPNLFRQAVDEAEHGARFVEVGAWKGRSTAYMGELIKASRKRIVFDVVDHWQGSVEHVGDPDVEAGRLRQVFDRNVAYVRDYIGTVYSGKSTDIAELYEDFSLDFVFIDTSHDAESVAMDCAAWWPKVKAGGVLAGDDWGFEGVQDGVYSYFCHLPVEVEPIDAGWRMRKDFDELS